MSKIFEILESFISIVFVSTLLYIDEINKQTVRVLTFNIQGYACMNSYESCTLWTLDGGREQSEAKTNP